MGRNHQKIREGVHPNVLLELERVYRYGAPREVNATNTEENLLQYFLYGNHESVTKNPAVRKGHHQRLQTW